MPYAYNKFKWLCCNKLVAKGFYYTCEKLDYFSYWSINVSLLHISYFNFTNFLDTTSKYNNYSYHYHLPCRSITLLDFEISSSCAPLIANLKNLSILITSQEDTPSSSNKDPSSKRHCPFHILQPHSSCHSIFPSKR